ncbi:MAG: preprotein translocase subunit SecE [Candidatus Pacebacteria bacterium]|jgi:preprotein translocase subunit SecE|nr:preprotein translocase subunit SecE [Candidatus Paceibacterota bacterium]
MAMFNFIKETKNEMKHVNWPTRKKTIKYTLVVIIASLILAIILGAFDTLFIKIINLIVN